MSKKITTFSKVIILIFLSYFVFIGSTLPINTLSNIETITAITPYQIEHLVFETLIAFPEKAFSPLNNLSTQYDENKITVFEFENILDSLYKNNYILININDIYEITNNQIYIKNIHLPQNKKPLILSFDNVNYKSNYQNSGQIDKIIIDRNNQLASYTTKQSIQDRVNYNNEFILILENFIQAHPDFSHNNARGIIFLTGENGILGYNTNHKNASSKYESKKALRVIQKLKSLGWIFGSNGYSYSDHSQINDIQLAKQIDLWQKEISPLIGDTKLFAYPYETNYSSNSTKQEILNNHFQFYFTNSNEPNLSHQNNTLIMTRRMINGNTLRENKDKLSHLFDSEQVYDHTNRPIPFNSLWQ